MTQDEHINEIDVSGMLEDAQDQLADCNQQLNAAHDKLFAIREQFAAAENEVLRISHNIIATVEFIGKAHAKLVTGGQE